MLINMEYNVIEEYNKDINKLDLIKEINYKLYRIIIILEGA